VRVAPQTLATHARRAALAACVILAGAVPAFCQQPLADPPSTFEFFPRYDFLMSAAALGEDDPHFSWDIHWAGDFDLIDYERGRLMFLADYQTILGNEFRPFDPYQSNYTLEASGSVRDGPTEFVVVLNHVSRHLGDRPKRIAVADNSLGGRVMRQVAAGPGTVDLRGDLRWVIARAYVDYTWIAVGDATLRRSISERVGVYGVGNIELYGVDKSIAGRDNQVGARLEAGVRLSGRGGAVELFAGWERMVDADPIDRLARQWGFAGFRLVGR
jgi:hypothetical protein